MRSRPSLCLFSSSSLFTLVQTSCFVKLRKGAFVAICNSHVTTTLHSVIQGSNLEVLRTTLNLTKLTHYYHPDQTITTLIQRDFIHLDYYCLMMYYTVCLQPLKTIYFARDLGLPVDNLIPSCELVWLKKVWSFRHDRQLPASYNRSHRTYRFRPPPPSTSQSYFCCHFHRHSS